MGHIHTYQKFDSVYFCPTLVQTKFGQSDKKGFFDVTFSTKKGKTTPSVKFINVPPPFYLKQVKIESHEQLKSWKRENNTYYSLLVAEGIVIPPSFLAKNDGIVNVTTQTSVGVNSSGDVDIASASYDDSYDMIRDDIKNHIEGIDVDSSIKKGALALFDSLLADISNGR